MIYSTSPRSTDAEKDDLLEKMEEKQGTKISYTTVKKNFEVNKLSKWAFTIDI